MFNKKTINKIKLLAQDKKLEADKNWLKKSQENLRQFMIENPSVRKSKADSQHIVEKVDLTQLNAQKTPFLGLRLKPMSIIVSILIVALLAGGGATATVQAQDALPGETLYPVKLVSEKVQLAFSGQEGDVRLHTKFATQRAEEIEELISQTEGGIEPVEIKAKLIKQTAEKLKREVELSEKGLAKLEKKGKGVTELALKVEEATNQHLEVLQGLTAKAPEPAQEALEHAYQASSHGQVTAINAIIKAGEKGYAQDLAEAVQQRIEVRLNEAKTSIQETQDVIESVKAVEGTPVIQPEEQKVIGGGQGAVFVEVETKIEVVNDSIQKTQTSLDQKELPQALEEIKKVNQIVNEIETTLPSGTDEQEYITPPVPGKTCLQQGEKGNYFATDQCCTGLTKAAITIYDPDSGVCAAEQSGAFVCIRCGDGVCGLGENVCNCAQDCKKQGETVPTCGNGICETGEADHSYCPPCTSVTPPCLAPCEFKAGTCPEDCNWGEADDVDNQSKDKLQAAPVIEVKSELTQ